MKAATISEIKRELNHLSVKDLTNLCLRLARFKVENKELLTYLLYDSGDEAGYIQSVKLAIDEQFEGLNTSSYYLIKKSLRKTLRLIKKYIRYSGHKQTAVELLLHFCLRLKEMRPPYQKNQVLLNLYERQIESIKKAVLGLPEDLQYDYGMELDSLNR